MSQRDTLTRYPTVTSCRSHNLCFVTPGTSAFLLLFLTFPRFLDSYAISRYSFCFKVCTEIETTHRCCCVLSNSDLSLASTPKKQLGSSAGKLRPQNIYAVGSESFRNSGLLCTKTGVYWAVQRVGCGMGGPCFDSRLVQECFIFFYFCILTGVQMFLLLWQTREGRYTRHVKEKMTMYSARG
jgi:hypothetical protein